MCHQYRHGLSDYESDIADGKWGNKKVEQLSETGEVVATKTVYIAQRENLGANMCIDDKEINHQSFTIMTNQDTGKIAFVMDSVKSSELEKGMSFLGDTVKAIKSISCDMAPSYLHFCRTSLPSATIVVDKFHVMRYVYDAVQSVRMDIRAALFEQMPRGKKQLKDEGLMSELELLKRSRIPLSRSKKSWSAAQVSMMEMLFKKQPQLQIAYQLAQDFKQWYDKSNAGKSSIALKRELYLWYEKVEKSKLRCFEPCVKMIEKHEEEIINYFQNAQTNAKAERINGKIERFISNNYGVRNLDFTMYRIKGYFA